MLGEPTIDLYILSNQFCRKYLAKIEGAKEANMNEKRTRISGGKRKGVKKLGRLSRKITSVISVKTKCI